MSIDDTRFYWEIGGPPAHGPTEARMKRVGIYLRVSTDAQTTENQKRELEAVAARSGWQVVGIYEDAGNQRRQGFAISARIRSTDQAAIAALRNVRNVRKVLTASGLELV
jgi:hypothetical protein